MPYEPKVISPYLYLSPFLSPEQSKAVIPGGINYLDYNKYTKKNYHSYCRKVKDDNAECIYNDDVKNEEKLKNNLGCLYGRIEKNLYEGDRDVGHQSQIKYHVAYTKKCINLLHKPPLKRAPSDFISLLKNKMENKAPYTDETLLKETIYNTAEVFGKVIKTSAQEIDERHKIQRRTHKNRKEYLDRMNDLYTKAIIDSASEITSDIAKKGTSSDYFTPVFSSVLTTKTKISEKKATILAKLKSQADKYSFEDHKYKYNDRLIDETGHKMYKITDKMNDIINDELMKLIDDLPQLKELEAKRAAENVEAKRAAENAEAKKAAANASKSEARTKEQEIKKLEKKIREIKHLEEQNQSKLTSEQRTKLASKQRITNSLQKLKSSQGGTRKLRR